RIPTETSSGSSRSSGEPVVDEPRRARGEGHDRDHRIYSGRGRQEAPVPDPQIPDLMAFPGWSRGRCPRVEPRPRGAHGMCREQAERVLPNAEAAHPIDERVEFPRTNRGAPVAHRTLPKVERSDAARARGALEPGGLLQSAADGPAVP